MPPIPPPTSGAIFTITFKHDRLSLDSLALSKVQAVDLSQELLLPQIDLVPCKDTSSITGPGEITRVILVPFTAEFVLAYPTADLQRGALNALMTGPIRVQVPAYDVEVAITLVDPIVCI
jgi:hypothetical protein